MIKCHSVILTDEIPCIPGVDTKQGILNTGGTLENYCKVLFAFDRDVNERLEFLQTTPNEASLSNFVTHIHAIKSSLATLGAKEISVKAAELEAAGNKKDLNFINEKLPVFFKELIELQINFHSMTETIEAIIKKTVPSTPLDSLSPLFKKLVIAIEIKSALEIDQVLEEICKNPLDIRTKQVVEEISNEILITEYEKALQMIRKLIDIS